MTNHYDEMQVAPDPVKAEELRQRLHARMANISTEDQPGRSALELDSDGHPDEWIVPMNELTASDTSTPSNRTHRRRVLVAAAAIAAVIAAGVIAIKIEDPSRVATNAPTPTTTPPNTTPTTTPPDTSCPFTAEQVSEVIGVTITGPESSTQCRFGNVFPGVSFEYLPASACTQESLRDPESGENPPAVDGFGVDAYSGTVSLGMWFIVCNGDRPFRLVIDGVQGDDLAFAVALARIVLNGDDDDSSTATTESSTTTSEAGGPTILARGEDVRFVDYGGSGGLVGHTLNVDAEREHGAVTGEFRVDNVVVTLQCADTETIDGEIRLGGVVTDDPDGQGLAVIDGEVAVGDRVALIIREQGHDYDQVTLFANDGAGSCAELVESFPYNNAGGFFSDAEDGDAIETGGVEFRP